MSFDKVHGYTVSDSDAPEGEDQEPQEEQSPEVSEESSASLDPQVVMEVAAEKIGREKKKNSSYKERLQTLSAENRYKEQVNYNLQLQLQEKERLLAEREAELSRKDKQHQNLFQSNLEAEENTILQDLRYAKQDGDIDREVTLSRDLARVKAEQAAFDVLKATTPPSYQEEDETVFTPHPQGQNPYDYAAHQDFTQPELPEEFSDFLERNTWLNPNSDHFDESLASEANDLAAEFNKRLRLKGSAEMIGTSAYYDAIEGYMKNKYDSSDSSADTRDREDYSPARTTSYSPGMSNRSMADSYRQSSGNSRTSLSLTPQEYRIARNLQIPDPQSPNSFLSSEKAIEMYARNKAQFSRETPDKTFKFRVE